MNYYIFILNDRQLLKEYGRLKSTNTKGSIKHIEQYKLQNKANQRQGYKWVGWVDM